MHAIILGRPSRRLFEQHARLRGLAALLSLHRLVIISIGAGTFVVVLAGCQQGRLMTPLASRRSMDNTPPSIHGPSMAGSAQSRAATQSGTQKSAPQIQITSESAVPETDIEPVEQRLATNRQVARRTASGTTGTKPDAAPKITPAATENAMSEIAVQAPIAPVTATLASAPQLHPIPQEIIDAEIAQVSATMPLDPLPLDPLPKSSFALPQVYSGVDVRELLAALENAPPELQQDAVAKLIAISRSRARETAQPLAIDDALAAAFDELPELPTVVPDRDAKPSRIGTSEPSSKSGIAAVQSEVSQAIVQTLAVEPTIQQASLEKIHEPTIDAAMQTLSNPIEIASASPASAAIANAPQNMTFSDQEVPLQNVSMSLSDSPKAPEQEIMPETERGVAAFSDAELFNALVARLQVPTPGESDAERHRRQVVSRHLMVLSGDPERAVDQLEGLSEEESQYLRHQLLGLWKIVDPQGHPVPSHRFSSALPEIRKATGYLAAASNSLEVRALEFCTEIESYGQIKPFPNRRFSAGQEVILYCEIDNFVSHSVEGGFETRLRGTYDLLDANGERIASQTLPEDHQTSKNHLRDYFIAYQMYLPEAVDPGRYQLRLTMEDIHGKKYGQATVDFEIKR